MASLFKSGLVHGFAVFDKKPIDLPAPSPDVLLSLDLSDDAAIDRFTAVKEAFANSQTPNEKGLVRVAMPVSTWVEITIDNERDEDDLFRVYGIHILLHESVMTFDASVWVCDGSRKQVYKIIQADMHVNSEDPHEAISDFLAVGSLKTYAGHGMAPDVKESINEDLLWLVRQSYTLMFMFGGGCVRSKTKPQGGGRLLFSEERSLKKNKFDLVNRKRLLKQFEVHEVDAELSLAAAEDMGWQEFDPIAARREGHHGPRSECRQHVVREFKRRSKSGKVSTVKSFLRGNPSLGFVHKMQRVTIPE